MNASDKRAVARFAVRSTSDLTVEEMAELAGTPLGCEFSQAKYHHIPVMTANLLGMRIVLFDWTGPDGVRSFILQGEVEDFDFLDVPDGSELEPLRVDLSQVVIDLLHVKKAGEWHLPTPAELAAQTPYRVSLEFTFSRAWPKTVEGVLAEIGVEMQDASADAVHAVRGLLGKTLRCLIPQR